MEVGAPELMRPEAGLSGTSRPPAQWVCSMWPSSCLVGYRAFSQTQSLDWAAGGRKRIALLGFFRHQAFLVLTWLWDIEEGLGLGPAVPSSPVTAWAESYPKCCSFLLSSLYRGWVLPLCVCVSPHPRCLACGRGPR